MEVKNMLKRCSKCKQEFPATLEFFYQRGAADGSFRPQCKTCTIEYQTKLQKTEAGKTAHAKRQRTYNKKQAEMLRKK